MKRLTALSLVLFVFACNQPGNDQSATKDSVTIISNDTIPEIRTSIKSTPAAEYSEPIKDELNKWKFAVELYETKRTFHFTMRIQAKEARVTDSVNIPNFGIWPKLEIRKDKEPLTCIVGFLNKKNEFMPYRQVSFQNDRLQIKSLATYSVGVYKTKASQ